MTTATKAPGRAKKAAPAKDAADILGRAMLVNVVLGVWEARKHDKVVTDKVNQKYASSHDAGRWHKHLFGGSTESLGRVLTAASNVRLTHYAQTLPWSDSGWRILPTENYFQYTEAMRKAIAEYDKAAEEFVKDYPRLVREAKDKLNGMYRREDYPDASQVRAKYYATIDYAPVPAGEDFRVELPKAELAAMAKSVERGIQQSVQVAMAEAWQRLGKVVDELRPRLADGKYLRDTMISGVKEVAESLGRLNLTEDAALEAVRQQTLQDLGTLNVEVLKKDEGACQAAAKKADAILKQMAGLYVPAKKKEGK